MPSAKFRSVIAPRARTLNIIWFAFLLAPFFYTVVGWVVTRTPRADGGTNAPLGLLQALFVVVGVTAAVVSYVYPRRALADDRITSLLRGPFAAPPPPGAGGLEPLEQRLVLLFPHYQNTVIVSLALRESLAVLGLVLAIMSGDFTLMVPWSVLAVGLLTSQPPRPAAFLDRALPLARSAG